MSNEGKSANPDVQSSEQIKNSASETGAEEESVIPAARATPSYAGKSQFLLKDLQSDPLQDEDIMKIDRLQLINASARYQLLSANQ